MTVPAVLLDPLEALVWGQDPGQVRVALALPGAGPLGMARPAAIAAAVLAAETVNDGGGVRDRPLRLIPVDAGAGPAGSAAALAPLVDGGLVDAVVGFHTSDVHRALERVTAGRVPYFFTAPHEGGHRLPGVVRVGPGPLRQLAGPIRELSRAGARRWALVGSDYVWPRSVHRAVRRVIREAGGEVVGERLEPLGGSRPAEAVRTVESWRPDAVLLSMVGRDLALFNRAFAASAMQGRVLRLSGGLEETGLLEIEGDRTGSLFSAMDWYAGDPEDEVSLRYARRWGEVRPPLASYARSCFDGLMLFAETAAEGRLDPARPWAGLRPEEAVTLARPGVLACAEGVMLRPLARS